MKKSQIRYATHILDGLNQWPTHIAHLNNGILNEATPYIQLIQTYSSQIKIRNTDNNKDQNNKDQNNNNNNPPSESDEKSEKEKEKEKEDEMNICSYDSPLLQLAEKLLRMEFVEKKRRKMSQDPDFEDKLKKSDIYHVLAYSTSTDRYYNYWNK